MYSRSEQYNLSFPVLIVQINASERVELPENGKVEINFDIPMVCAINTNINNR